MKKDRIERNKRKKYIPGESFKTGNWNILETINYIKKCLDNSLMMSREELIAIIIVS